jgi:polysaccharide export outer membrane protein
MPRRRRLLAPLLLLPLFAGCSLLPGTGPTLTTMDDAARNTSIQVVEVNGAVTRELQAREHRELFSESLGTGAPATETSNVIGAGDAIEINIWEAPPATLFGEGVLGARGLSTSHGTALPEQVVDAQGRIKVPFVGRIDVAGQSTAEVEDRITAALKGKANQPQVLVRLLHNQSAAVTVVGEVTTSVRMPLTPGHERVLDALAAAGGVRQPIGKTSLQLTRGDRYLSMPLDMVIRDPRQNVPLRPGDVLTAMFQPLSFTALGATGKNEEISFETQGISLAQALARAGGLNDLRSSPQGAFVFRFEAPDALAWPHSPAVKTADGLVPVVYRFDLRDPGNFFVMQNFGIHNHDLLYVSNAPLSELQKFLNLLATAFYPIVTVNSLR